jgi:hypothetical protein
VVWDNGILNNLVWDKGNVGTANAFNVLSYKGETLGVPIHVFGPETHMTAIVGMALGKRKVTPPAKRQMTTANFLLPGGQVCIYHDVRYIDVLCTLL